jgi:hypothetical protein
MRWLALGALSFFLFMGWSAPSQAQAPAGEAGKAGAPPPPPFGLSLKPSAPLSLPVPAATPSSAPNAVASRPAGPTAVPPFVLVVPPPTPEEERQWANVPQEERPLPELEARVQPPFQGACDAELQKFCPQVKPGGGALMKCLSEGLKKDPKAGLSPKCGGALRWVVEQHQKTGQACQGWIVSACARHKGDLVEVFRCLRDLPHQLTPQCREEARKLYYP